MVKVKDLQMQAPMLTQTLVQALVQTLQQMLAQLEGLKDNSVHKIPSLTLELRKLKVLMNLDITYL